MSKDEQIAKEFEEYQKVAKENKNVDVAALMINALNKKDEAIIPSNKKRWAYLISAGAPPFGLFFALRYYFSDEDDGKTVAYICIILTIASSLAFWGITKALFSSAGVTPAQLQQLKPKDALELTQ